MKTKEIFRRIGLFFGTMFLFIVGSLGITSMGIYQYNWSESTILIFAGLYSVVVVFFLLNALREPLKKEIKDES